ncbi:MAG: hypothetical protein DLM57_06075 [Pseudonocardiales bacterium]|nr:MAG: hypothetical protein DLM57_06075 [Pseudonocardiales bacterium]
MRGGSLMEMDDTLTELMNTSGGRLLRLAYQLTHDRSTAEDLVQEALMQVYRSCGAARPASRTVRPMYGAPWSTSTCAAAGCTRAASSSPPTCPRQLAARASTRASSTATPCGRRWPHCHRDSAQCWYCATTRRCPTHRSRR